MKTHHPYFFIIACFLIFIGYGCSSSDGDSTPTPVAKVLISNGTDGEITSVTGVSSIGTKHEFVITSTDVNNATPNILEKGEVGVIEITECDVLWELSFSVSFPDDPPDNITVVQEMQMYSCDTEYEYSCLTQTFVFLGEEITVTQCTLKQ